MHTPTITLDIRSSKTSDEPSSSDYCKTHKDSDMCQKPVSNDVLTIVLSIILPLTAITCVLGYFLYRNYRKDKKESMEHDPDFDENGEATALPDFPELKSYGNQNPFNNNNRYPMDQQFRNPQYQQYQRQPDAYSNYSEKLQSPDPYTFVLPYQHQTGSKVSLDDYARNLGDSQGYNTSVSSTTQLNQVNQYDHSSNNSSNMYNNGVVSTTPPRRSNLYMEHSRTPSDPVSPTRNNMHENPDRGMHYNNVAQPGMNYDNVAPQGMHYGNATHPGMHYDNSRRPFNQDTPMVAPNIQDDSYSMTSLTFDKRMDTPETNVSIPQIVIQDENAYRLAKSRSDRSSSPFDTDSETREKQHSNETESTKTSPFEETHPKRNFPQENSAEDTFDFSQSDRILDDSHMNNSTVSNMGNIENEQGVIYAEEQEEQIKRMKSVYNVYFDPEVTMHDQELAPLPQIHYNELRDNNHDHARYSTSSSVYDNQTEIGYQHQYQPGPAREYPTAIRPQQRLPPLKPIPNASEIRKSTLETYTNYQPKSSSPQLRHYVSSNDGELNDAGYFSPPQQHSPKFNGPVPSASQVARNSVVMTDPAVEISKSRKFKPAGSSFPQSGSMNFGESRFDQDNDFVPGSRRSDVRRILNNH
ncbi:hypothetical protein JA1_003294 [Spathaspora sp. JA1]|nr:hypothetical protein JA1_003294 [Spathaspora sp. JA1]